jgi:hypothetical protein
MGKTFQAVWEYWLIDHGDNNECMLLLDNTETLEK